MYKSDFPLFSHHPGLIYLDSAATAQKPQVVIDAVTTTLTKHYGPVGRSLYPLGVQATEAYEHTRQVAANFFHALPQEIVLLSNATAAFNLLARSLEPTLQEGDEIILSDLEHHSNILPWKILAERHSLTLHFLPITAAGEIELEKLPSLLTERTKIISLTHCSNVVGTITDLSQVKKLLEQQGSRAIFIVDGCQSAPHFPLVLPELGCDFFIASGHKMYGPSGIGILWGRASILDTLPASLPGGGTVEGLRHDLVVWKESPARFEAGTPNLEGLVGYTAALTYLQGIGMDTVQSHTNHMATLLLQELGQIHGVSILGTPHPDSGIVAFTVDNIHAHDIAELLGQEQVCVRAGHHCAGPLHEQLGIPASCRASIGLYTEEADIYRLAENLKRIQERFHA